MEWQLLSARLSRFNINKGVLEQLKHEPLSVLKSTKSPRHTDGGAHSGKRDPEILLIQPQERW